jgi:four helix bundle protein
MNVENGIAAGRKQLVKRHSDLDVYKRAYSAAMQIFELTKRFPKEERYSLTDQIRRSTRSVCSNIGEAWRKRRYPAAFVSKLSDSEGEAGETQVWIEFAVGCGYLPKDTGRKLYREYDVILGMLVRMITNSDKWALQS